MLSAALPSMVIASGAALLSSVPVLRRHARYAGERGTIRSCAYWGGWNYVTLSTVAALTFRVTGRIEMSILAHFLPNATRFCS